MSHDWLKLNDAVSSFNVIFVTKSPLAFCVVSKLTLSTVVPKQLPQPALGLKLLVNSTILPDATLLILKTILLL